MKLLAIGGCHTCGVGVDFQHGYVRRVALKLAQDHPHATVDYHAPLKLARLVPLLNRLADQLPDYDLILLQPAHFELVHTRFRHLFEPVDARPPADADVGYTVIIDHQARPATVHAFHQNLRHVGYDGLDVPPPASTWSDNLRRAVKLTIISQMHRRGWVARLNYIAQTMTPALAGLQSVRERVVLVSPMPVHDPFICHLRRLVCNDLLKQCERSGIAFVDSFAALHPHNSVLLPDGCHLNALGHAQLSEAILTQCQQTGRLHPRKPALMPVFP